MIPKRGLARYTEGKLIISMPPCRGRCTLLKWRLRRHLPPSAQQVASQLKHAPEAPPAPAGSILVIRSVAGTTVQDLEIIGHFHFVAPNVL